MKKIGILTMYHNSINYGGILQAYALQTFLEKKGFDSKQICFQKESQTLKKSFKLHYNELGMLKTILWGYDRIKRNILCKISNKVIDSKEKKLYKKRLENFLKFRDEIPHTDNIYNSKTIHETNDLFDIFCCGSDQIWKPGVICPEYLLSFVNDEKIKISYAASISKTNIEKENIDFMIPYLKRFNNISVRELFDKNILSKYIDKTIEWVVDPTLLLNRDEWEQLCINNIVSDNYLFCYLLEPNPRKYKIITQFAKKNNLKIVTIPFASGQLNLRDEKFGDIHITDAGPKEFLSLIHDAKIVITDSFHATVFSNIFETNFFVLERSEAPTMNSRITSLLKIFNRCEKFIEDKELVNCNVHYHFDNSCEYENMKKKSIEYLLSNVYKLEVKQ